MALQNSKWLIRTSIQWSNHISIAMCSDLIVCHMPSFKFHLAADPSLEAFQQKENKALKTHIVRTSILIPQILNFFFFRNLLSILDCQLQTLYKSLMVFYGVTVERSFCYYINQLRESKIRLFSIQMSKQPKKIMGKSENLHQTCRRWISSHFVPRPEIANHWRCNPNGAPCLKRREAGRVSEFPIWISIYRGPSTCLTWKHIEIRDVKHESIVAWMEKCHRLC